MTRQVSTFTDNDIRGESLFLYLIPIPQHRGREILSPFSKRLARKYSQFWVGNIVGNISLKISIQSHILLVQPLSINLKGHNSQTQDEDKTNKCHTVRYFDCTYEYSGCLGTIICFIPTIDLDISLRLGIAHGTCNSACNPIHFGTCARHN